MDSESNDLDDLVESDSQSDPSWVPPAALTGFLFLASVLIVVATPSGWPLGIGTRQIVLASVMGCFLALPPLISLWIVFGQQAWFIRVPLASGILTILLLILLLTPTEKSVLFSPGEVFWSYVGVALWILVGVQVPLWFVRFGKQIRIGRQKPGYSARTQLSTRTQLSVKQLLLATAVFAFLLVALKWIGTHVNAGTLD